MNAKIRNSHFENVYLPIEHQARYCVLLCLYYAVFSFILLVLWYLFNYQHYDNFVDFIIQKRNYIFSAMAFTIIPLLFNRHLQPQLPTLFYPYVLHTELYQDWKNPQPISGTAQILSYEYRPKNFLNPASSRFLLQFSTDSDAIWCNAQLSALFFQNIHNKVISKNLKWHPQQKVDVSYLPHSKTIIAMSNHDELGLTQLNNFLTTAQQFNEIPSLFLQQFHMIKRIEAHRTQGEFHYFLHIHTEMGLNFPISDQAIAFKTLELHLAYKIDFLAYRAFKQNPQNSFALLYKT